MAKYLVTGVAGFIANRITAMLLADGHQVIGIDNMNHAYDVRMKEYRLEKLSGQPGFEFLRQDISDKEATLDLIDKVNGAEAVINLAARAGVRDSVIDPWMYVNTNFIGTLNLLELSRRAGIPKFVLASTSGIYGLNAPLPTPETAESSRPLQPYAASKKSAETMAHAYHFLHGIDVTVLRFFSVYGPAGRPDMVMFRFIKWILDGQPLQINGDGNQTRGFSYVDDIARGAIQALRPLGYETINLGGHELISLNELIALLEEITGKKASVNFHPAHKADMLTSQADTTKARELLGWEPQVDLNEGVREMVNWYLENVGWAKDIDLGL